MIERSPSRWKPAEIDPGRPGLGSVGAGVSSPWLGLVLTLLVSAAPFLAPTDSIAQRTTRADQKAAAAGVSLTVRISELESDKGRVAVALFASSQDFPDQKRASAGKLTRISGGRASVTFTNLRPGIYAVAVLHDENENSKMDFNFLGMPLEGYGFSNDASAPFGPPSFAAAAFKLVPRNSFVAIKTRYFP
jgi:uncharacterized protein (DUF2141 family)